MSVAATPTSAVIICAYTDERLDDIRSAVRSVQSQQPAPDELLLVVDHNPALRERLQGELTGVTILENRHRQGLAGARNTGVEAATGDIVVFLDDDAAAEPGWLAALLDTYREPDVLGAGGVIDPIWPGDRPRWLPAEFDWVVGCTYRGGATTRSPIRNLIGASMSLRRGVFDAAGGFTEGMGRIGRRPLGCEETELCLRVNRHFPTGTFLFEPAAAVRHRVSPDRTHPRYFVSRCYAEGLSKATVAHLAGSDRGLAAERAHAAPRLARRGRPRAPRYGPRRHRRPVPCHLHHRGTRGHDRRLRPGTPGPHDVDRRSAPPSAAPERRHPRCRSGLTSTSTARSACASPPTPRPPPSSR